MESGEREAAEEETDRAEMAGEEARMGPEAAVVEGVECPRCGRVVDPDVRFCAGCTWRL